MSAPRYEVWRGADAQWYWHLRAPNAQVVAQGEGYKRKGGALGGVAAHKRSAVRAGVMLLEHPPAWVASDVGIGQE